MWATALTSTSAKAVKKHLVQAIAVLGKPMQIKTDNGPAYWSESVAEFMQKWEIQHL